MKRRQFLKTMGTGLAAVAALLLPAKKDVTPAETITQVSDTGGYLVPQEYQNELLQLFAKHDSKDIEEHMNQEMALGMALELDREILYGDGHSKPIGILVNGVDGGDHHELKPARSIANRRSEWPGVTTTWQET